MIDLLPIWKSEFENLPKNAKTTPQAMQNLSNYVAARVSGMTLGPPLIGSVTFTWVSSAFLSPLLSLQAGTDPTSGPMGFANAFQAGVLASQMVVGAGASIGAPTPPTTFSAPPVVTPFPVALTAAYASLLSGLLSLQPSGGPSQMPSQLNTAFTSLQYLLVGLNSIVPTPTPLVAIVPVM